MSRATWEALWEKYGARYVAWGGNVSAPEQATYLWGRMGPLIAGAERLMDFGCGWGRMARFAAPCVGEYWGVDVNRAALEGQWRMSNARYSPIEGDKLPVPDGWATRIMTVTVLQHMDDADVRKWAQELRRTCASGGSLVMVEAMPEPGGEERPATGNLWLRRPETLARLVGGRLKKTEDVSSRRLAKKWTIGMSVVVGF